MCLRSLNQAGTILTRKKHYTMSLLCPQILHASLGVIRTVIMVPPLQACCPSIIFCNMAIVRIPILQLRKVKDLA